MIPELILPEQFSVNVTSPEYQFSEQKFYAGNISRVSLTKARKTATITIVIKPLRFSYYVTLRDFFAQVKQHKNFKVSRSALVAKNKTIPYLLPDVRLFFFELPLKIDEKNIGHTGVLQSITLTLRESYQLVPIPPIVIPSALSVSYARKIARVARILN